MLGIFDVFKIGIGPSSSHTMGPMRAACDFVRLLKNKNALTATKKINVYLLGSLAYTGKGHATDQAVICGLAGEMPDVIDPDNIPKIVAAVQKTSKLNLLGKHQITFDITKNIIWQYQRTLPEHPNGLEIIAYDEHNIVIENETYISIGGGFISSLTDFKDKTNQQEQHLSLYNYDSAQELLALGEKHNLSISEIAIANDIAQINDKQLVFDKIDQIWQVMHNCIQRGIKTTGHLPVSNLARRANTMHAAIKANPKCKEIDPFQIMDWVSLFAVAVNEENAAGGRIVTAPTNGAAGVVPAVLQYYNKFIGNNSVEGTREFIATAAAIGIIIIKNASISGAEAGCQAEVGSACAMAAAGLVAAKGGTNKQIEHAAEIGLEHNLGMTCDPVAGLVQIPCIERNAMAAVKAINAARMALQTDGNHAIPLDTCIKTMYETGLDLQEKYRETSLGGLASNFSFNRKDGTLPDLKDGAS